MDRFVCIHSHFYQPPRENPWLEAVELQDSAYPFHDWNERITAECYAPNSASRILDSSGRIERIVNNYSRISFNVGPTLLSWLETEEPLIYASILAADRESQKLFGGHGSAIAQAYNHAILPLANRRDKYTQVRWGIADFKKRFGRFPEGMWLAETAVDHQTLEVLAELGIKYTILSPYQAAKFRKIGARGFRDVSGGRIDPTRPYLVRLHSGRSINVFFYDGPISRAVAFEKLLNRGEEFAARLISGFSHDRDWPQLMHIATDGETYGHHHPHGDMALSYALQHIETNNLARLTNYGEYLEQFPPDHEVQIFENTSWSCAHGVERWNSNCGCNTGRHDWNQEWRGPLRAALDWLRDEMAPRFESEGSQLFEDPWAARDAYIAVILDRTPQNVDAFLDRCSLKPLSAPERVRALKMLEMQRHAMLMYTSCGWFFDELSGIETVQVIQYAGRAIQLYRDLFADDLEPGFLQRLQHARSNMQHWGNGADIYRKTVVPAMVDLPKMGAHYAISSLFERRVADVPIFSYSVDHPDFTTLENGVARLSFGRTTVTSNITRESARLVFCVLHPGDYNLLAAVRPLHTSSDANDQSFAAAIAQVSSAFQAGDMPRALHLMAENFAGSLYSLQSLFRDQQRKIVSSIISMSLSGLESSYRYIYQHQAPLIRFLRETGNPLPQVLGITAEFVLNSELRKAFSAETLDLQRIHSLYSRVIAENVPLDGQRLAYDLRHSLNRMMEKLRDTSPDAPHALEHLRQVSAAVGFARSLPFEVSLWKMQNIYSQMLPAAAAVQSRTDDAARQWLAEFVTLGDRLRINVDLAPARPPLAMAS